MGALEAEKKKTSCWFLIQLYCVNYGQETPVAAGKLEPTSLIMVFSVM